MRWKCESQGCFETKLRCQLGKLDHLLPGSNAMTDIDGYCHINGHLLFLEWKSRPGKVVGRQLEALKALSRNATVVLAWGDPREMTPTAFEVYQDGDLVYRIKGEGADRKFDMFIKMWGADALASTEGLKV